MDDREWVFCRTHVLLVGVPSRNGGEERTIPAETECYMPKRDAQRHERRDRVTILEDPS